MTRLNTAADGRTVTVRVPISIRRRGGRKLVLAPDGAEITAAPATRHVDNAMVKAIARAFRWRDMLESGECAAIRKIAAVENICLAMAGVIAPWPPQTNSTIQTHVVILSCQPVRPTHRG
jgi:hypothetical protein